MKRKIVLVIAVGLFILGAGKLSFAQQDHSEHEQGASASVAGAVSGEAVNPVRNPDKYLLSVSNGANVGNKICPVSGEKIDDKMKATYEYQGKIYNFCCAGCVGSFKADPDKYIKIVDEELSQQADKLVK